ncbi:unnamed protein product [Rotaria magnacalcarata]|uniref:MULE transposase domain-containing protein n=1 Tax=Rotaria magnacalcarata TaxID=392030 RepID=A0A8S2N6E1_9BILA|nr:unnamed protein product [Rotaria magnacalcarata]
MGCELKPSTIICDFERAFINAVVKELPNTAVTGCWFHFTQSCYRNIQKLGLMKLYDNDTDSRDLLRSFMGLALLPIDHIQEAFQILKLHVAASPHSKELRCFILYFKTQNHRLYTRVVQPHSNLWFFLQCLKQEETAKAHKSTRAAARKSKQIVKLLNLLASNQRSLVETISLFTYIVGGPVGRELLQHDHIIFERVLSECPPNFYYLPHEHSPIGESEVDIRQCTTWTLANNWRESYWRSSAIPNKYYK